MAKILTNLDFPAALSTLAPLVGRGPLVFQAPTGTGKSTRVPMALSDSGQRLVVVEPRRVACQSLAARVAELDGTALGERVGFHVRGSRMERDDTQILFVTPGIMLRRFDDLSQRDAILLDEFHERVAEVDLLLAVLRERQHPGLVVMSATLDAERIARYLGATAIVAEGRRFEVAVHYAPAPEQLHPTLRDLPDAVVRALGSDLVRGQGGHVLVFLPGKREIEACRLAVGDDPRFTVLPLHGGLSLEAQSRVFKKAPRRKLILSTNVAETSLTIDGVSVVIDSGLSRRTHYLRGRPHLTLQSVAQDSATQRAGRAGRTGPGACIRLWSQSAQLANATPPEVQREALEGLVLGAVACGHSVSSLTFLDPPREDALETAGQTLRHLGVFDAAGAVTERGRRMWRLPVDPWLARVLVQPQEAQGAGQRVTPLLWADVVDLVACLSVDRSMFHGTAPPPHAEFVHAERVLQSGGELLALPPHRSPQPASTDDPRAMGCDLSAMLFSLRAYAQRDAAGAMPIPRDVNAQAVCQAYETALRLRATLPDLPALASAPLAMSNRSALAQLLLAADPLFAHVGRRAEKAKRTDDLVSIPFSHGGTELRVGQGSAAHFWLARWAASGRSMPNPPLLAVLSVHASGEGRHARLWAQHAMPLALADVRVEGVLEHRVGDVLKLVGRPPNVRVEGVVEAFLAGVRVDTAPQVLAGGVLRSAVARLISEGRLFKDAAAETKRRLQYQRLASFVHKDYEAPSAVVPFLDADAQAVRAYFESQLYELGLESHDELALLSHGDLLPPEPPFELASSLYDAYPLSVDLGDVRYGAEIDFTKRVLILRRVSGGRTKPPPASFLPRFEGFRVFVEAGGTLHALRR